jgi:hypothetical protein
MCETLEGKDGDDEVGEAWLFLVPLEKVGGKSP